LRKHKTYNEYRENLLSIIYKHVNNNEYLFYEQFIYNFLGKKFNEINCDEFDEAWYIYKTVTIYKEYDINKYENNCNYIDNLLLNNIKPEYTDIDPNFTIKKYKEYLNKCVNELDKCFIEHFKPDDENDDLEEYSDESFIRRYEQCEMILYDISYSIIDKVDKVLERNIYNDAMTIIDRLSDTAKVNSWSNYFINNLKVCEYIINIYRCAMSG
jgi:hypothetical protein